MTTVKPTGRHNSFLFPILVSMTTFRVSSLLNGQPSLRHRFVLGEPRVCRRPAYPAVIIVSISIRRKKSREGEGGKGGEAEDSQCLDYQ
jgi:hypothetical protein